MSKKVLITGGSRGIGEGMVRYMAARGADIVFTYKNSAETANQLAQDMAAEHGIRCKAMACEIMKMDDVKATYEAALAYLDGLDVLINNAGITRDAPLMTMQEGEWHEVLNTNLTGTFNLTRCAVVTFLRRKAGSIINITSVSGLQGIKGQTNYAASKAGIIGFTRSLAKEVAPRGVTVNAIAPGFIETQMTQELTEARNKEALGQIPLKRFGKVEEVAALAWFLATDEARYITGQTLVVDGGLSI